MTPISFHCEDCDLKFVSRSEYLATAERQMHKAGWITRKRAWTTPSGAIWHHLDRVCPKCKMLRPAFLTQYPEGKEEK